MKNLKGYIYNAKSGLPVPQAIVRAGQNTANSTQTTNGGWFELSVDDNETFIEVYAIGTGDNGYTRLYIPANLNNLNDIPGNTFWNIELVNTPFETETIEYIEKRNKKKLWPVYAGLGLLALLLLTRKKKGRKR